MTNLKITRFLGKIEFLRKKTPKSCLRRKDPTREGVSFSRRKSKLIRLIHRNIAGLKQQVFKKK